MNRVCFFVVVLVISASRLSADQVSGNYFDRPSCDNHGSRSATEELGDPTVFSASQQIQHVSTFVSMPACPATDDPNLPNSLVVITNLTNRTWRDLYYVGDPSTVFTNVDGVGDAGVSILDGLAFRIDSIGVNRPLIFESIVADNLFQPGEQWQFIVQDFSSPIGAPDSFFSVGFADASVSAIETSAASIVQFVPEPASAMLWLLAVIGCAADRIRRCL